MAKKATKGPSYHVENCTFTGVQWDAKAVEAIQTVATALLNLTTLFRAQDIRVETMLKLGEKVEIGKGPETWPHGPEK